MSGHHTPVAQPHSPLHLVTRSIPRIDAFKQALITAFGDDGSPITALLDEVMADLCVVRNSLEVTP